MAAPDAQFTTLRRDVDDRFQSLRRELGVTAFGINLIVLAAGQRGRIHMHELQEEVYLVLEGRLTLGIEGVERVLEVDEIARIAPHTRRQLINAGPQRVVLLALGGAGEHHGRDALAWESWDEQGPGRAPQDVPLPDDLPLA